MDGIRSTQHMADLIKGFVLDANEAPKDERLALLRTVSQFERCGWHPGAMADALSKVDGVTINSGKINVAGESSTAFDSLESLMRTYMDLYGFDPKPQLYTMAEAADYLGISKAMMETYVTRRGEIHGSKIGRSWVFTQDALDHWQATQRRTPGRPSSEDEAEQE